MNIYRLSKGKFKLERQNENKNSIIPIPKPMLLVSIFKDWFFSPLLWWILVCKGRTWGLFSVCTELELPVQGCCPFSAVSTHPRGKRLHFSGCSLSTLLGKWQSLPPGTVHALDHRSTAPWKRGWSSRDLPVGMADCHQWKWPWTKASSQSSLKWDFLLEGAVNADNKQKGVGAQRL